MRQDIVRATVLLSGGGTNLQALINASTSDGPLHNVQFVRAITDKKDGEVGLARAEKAGIPTAKLNQLKFRHKTPPEESESRFNERWRHEYDAELAELVLKDAPDLVICAGFMHVYTKTFLTPFTRLSTPIINLHPSLPASAPEHIAGANALARAYERRYSPQSAVSACMDESSFEKTGLMIHYVIEHVDAGDPIVVDEIYFTESDRHDRQGFVERFHQREHVAIVEGTRRVVERIVGERTTRSGREDTGQQSLLKGDDSAPAATTT